MSDDQPPTISQSPHVRSYAGGIQARNATRNEERQKNSQVPNLAEAAASYRPDQGVMTPEQLGRVQRGEVAPPQGHTVLRPETIEGLRQLQAASQAAQAAQGGAPPPVPPSAPAGSPPSSPPAGSADPEPDLEDEAFVRVLRDAREDVIRNEAERKAVAARCAEIDLADGLLTGEFTQLVPVVPDKLLVKFRCLTPAEMDEIRLMVFDAVAEDRRKDILATDLLGFYQMVAMVAQLNKTVFVKHVTAEPPIGRLVFQREVFARKIAQFQAFPLPLISALSTHAGWFDIRVRELFVTTDRLKNG